jgi:4-oxalocrotonate tautomerase
MPIINVKVSAEKSEATSAAIAAMLLEKTGRILHKRADLTAITIDCVDPAHWIVGGRSLAAQGKRSFYFDIKVVDETNTKAEKAQYIEEGLARTRRLTTSQDIAFPGTVNPTVTRALTLMGIGGP